MIRMRRPLEKVAKVLLRNPRSKRYVQSTRDQSVAAKSTSRASAARLDPLGVTCPFKSQGDVYIPAGPTSKDYERSSLFRTENSSLRQQVTHQSASTKPIPFSEIPSPPGLPIIGTLAEFVRFGGGSQLHEYNLRRHNQLGPIYRESIAGNETLFVSDPELFNDVQRQEGHFPESLKQEAFKLYNQCNEEKNRGVFFLEGEEWWNTRKALNPILLKRTSSLMEQILIPFEEHLETYFHRWQTLAEQNEGRLPNAELEMYKLGFEGAAFIVYGRLYKKNWHKLNTDVATIVRQAQAVFEENNKMLVVPPKLAQRLNLKLWKNFESEYHQLLSTCRTFAELCIKDLENIDPANGCQQAGMLYRMHAETSLPYQTLVDATSGLVSTIDPPAVTLGWLFNTLGQYPEIQEGIYKELLEVCGTKEPPTYSHLRDLKLAKMFIKETMRMYPTAPFLARVMPEESKIGGYQVPKGQLVALSLYASHRNPQYFPDPLRFLPERWERRSNNSIISEEDVKDIQHHSSHAGVTDPTAFRPFGTGKRACLGKLIAEIILQLFVARTVQKFQITSDEVRPKMSTILVPDRSLNIRLKKREQP